MAPSATVFFFSGGTRLIISLPGTNRKYTNDLSGSSHFHNKNACSDYSTMSRKQSPCNCLDRPESGRDGSKNPAGKHCRTYRRCSKCPAGKHCRTFRN
jgi:hypothetical protein